MTIFPLAQISGCLGFENAQVTHLLNYSFHSFRNKILKGRDTTTGCFSQETVSQETVKVFLILQIQAQTHSLPRLPKSERTSLKPAFCCSVYASTETLPQANFFWTELCLPLSLPLDWELLEGRENVSSSLHPRAKHTVWCVSPLSLHVDPNLFTTSEGRMRACSLTISIPSLQRSSTTDRHLAALCCEQSSRHFENN